MLNFQLIIKFISFYLIDYMSEIRKSKIVNILTT